MPAQAQYAGVFGRMGFGARGIAMGNSLIADANGHASPYYNPALAPHLAGASLEASAGLLSLDRSLNFLQFAAPLEPRAGLAAGLIHAGVSGIEGRSSSGQVTGEFSTNEFAIFVAFGTRFTERVTGGAALRLYRADYFEGVSPATSISLSFGLGVRLTDALHLGLAVDDLLGRFAWDTSPLYEDRGSSTTDRFPTRLRAGLAYTLFDGRGIVTAEYESQFGYGETLVTDVTVFNGIPTQTTRSEDVVLHRAQGRLGGEYWLMDAFAVRAGVAGLGVDGVQGAQPAAGFAVRHQLGDLAFRLDYAFALAPYAVSTVHFLTLRVAL